MVSCMLFGLALALAEISAASTNGRSCPRKAASVALTEASTSAAAAAVKVAIPLSKTLTGATASSASESATIASSTVLAQSAKAIKSTSSGAYPFNQLVAFGDELTDNGNGSYAHGSTNGQKEYLFNTWTDGPVAVSYLADMLNVPLLDFAFGGTGGGATRGSSVSNVYTPADGKLPDGSMNPSVRDQIFNNYTANGAPSDIGNALHFVWAGNEDILQHTDVYWYEDPQNGWFVANVSELVTVNVERLLSLGAAHVFVPNLYTLERSMMLSTFLCDDKCHAANGLGAITTTVAKIIQNANAAIKAALMASQYAKQIIYYDAYGFMTEVMDNKDAHGFSQPLDTICDTGNASTDSWGYCLGPKNDWSGAKQVVWMTFNNPTTTMHELIAKDMKSTIDQFFGH